MSRDRQHAQSGRWVQVLLAVTLALSLLVLTLLDYAIGAHNTTAVVACVLLLGLLSSLSIGIHRRGRASLRRVPPAPADEISSTAALLILLALTALAATLRFYQLGQESFWYDETWTVAWGAQPLATILRSRSPLPFLVAHVGLFFTRTEAGLRLAPAFAGTLLIPATYLLGRSLYSRKVGLMASGILTISVYAIYHSQELRFYAWQMLFSTLTLYFLLRGIEYQRWHDWLGFALATVLNLYSHPFGLLLLASQGLYTVGILSWDLLLSSAARAAPWPRRLRSLRYQLLGPAAAASVALLAHTVVWPSLLDTLHSQAGAAGAGLASAGTISDLWLSLYVSTWAYKLPSGLLSLQNPALLGLMLGLLFLGLLSSQQGSSLPQRSSLPEWRSLPQSSSPRQRSLLAQRPAALILLFFLVPALALSAVQVRVYYRYLSYFLPVMVILVARGIDTLATAIRPSRRGRGAVVAILTILVAIPNFVQLPEYYLAIQKEQWREVIGFVESQWQPGDMVVVALDYFVPAPQPPLDWYRTVPDDELPWQFFPEDGELSDPSQLRELPSMIRGHPRVWFVLSADDAASGAAIAGALQDQYRQVERQDFLDFSAVLFEALSLTRSP